MKLLPFLSNRQSGIRYKNGSYSTSRQLNFDASLSRLVCWRKDAYYSCREYSDSPPFACQFRKDKEFDLLAVANEDGDLMLFNTEGKGLITSFLAHHNAIFDISWVPDRNHLVTAAADHRAYLFDMEICRLISCYQGHKESVRSVDVCTSQSSLMATGSKDGNICVWDRREKSGSHRLCDKPSILIHPSHIRSVETTANQRKNGQPAVMSSVSAVAFQDEFNLVSAGVADGVIKVWDLRKTYVSLKGRTHSPRYQLRYSDKSDGITKVVFDSSRKKLYACSTAKQILKFDCHTYNSEAIACYTGFKCNSYYVKLSLSCDDQYLLCGSSTHKAYIWKASQPGLPILELPGHTAEVTAVDWSPYTPTKLVTCGDDNRIQLWKVKDPDEMEDGQEKTVYAAAAPYSLVDNDSTCDRVVEIISTYSRHIASAIRQTTPRPIPTPAKTPTPTSITSFFSPLPPRTSLQSDAPLVDPGSSASPPPPSSPTSRSPCKTLNDNDVTATETPGPKSSVSGKENTSSKGAAPEPVERKNGTQVKRKLSDACPRKCKHHRRCGKTRGQTRCGLKIDTPPPEKHNIKKYFTVSPPQ